MHFCVSSPLVCVCSRELKVAILEHVTAPPPVPGSLRIATARVAFLERKMSLLDFMVVAIYFATVCGIGIYCSAETRISFPWPQIVKFSSTSRLGKKKLARYPTTRMIKWV